jgi:hypothetical protein
MWTALSNNSSPTVHPQRIEVATGLKDNGCIKEIGVKCKRLMK